MHPILIADHATRDARNDLAARSASFSEATLLRLALDEPQLVQYRVAYATAAAVWSRGSDNFDQVWREATNAAHEHQAADARTATPVRAEVTWRYVLVRDPEANIHVLGYSRTGSDSETLSDVSEAFWGEGLQRYFEGGGCEWLDEEEVAATNPAEWTVLATLTPEGQGDQP